MMLLLALLLVVLFSVFLTSLIKPNRFTDALLSCYLLSFADIVLVTEVASLANLLNNRFFVMAAHAVLAASAGMVWWLSGRPSLFPVVKFPMLDLRRQKKSLMGWADLYLLGGSVAVAYAIGALLVLIVPPNNNDSLNTHMSRVGYWLQHGSFSPWATPYTWQTIYPLAAQAEIFWTVLFWGSDQLAGMVQWLAAIVSMLAVFSLARLLQATRPQAVFASLVFATFPVVVLQSTTTQNDLIVAAVFAIAFYFFLSGTILQKNIYVVLSGLAVGLALGTKQTIVFVLPGFALVVLLLLIFRKITFSRLLLWGVSSVVAVALVGSYMYIQNMGRFGNPLGPQEVVAKNTGNLEIASLANQLAINSSRLMYQAVDLSGIPERFGIPLGSVKARLGTQVFGVLGMPIETGYTAPGHEFRLTDQPGLQEDRAWFGPVCFLLLFPASIYQLIVGIRSKDPLRIGLFVLALVYLFCIAAFRPGWDPYQGRYFILTVILLSPLTAFFVKPNRTNLVFRLFVVILAGVVLANTLRHNPAKPLMASPERYTLIHGDRIDRITMQSGSLKEVLRAVESEVPEDAILGLYTYQGYGDYPLFGEHFSRVIIPIYPGENLGRLSWMQDQGIEYLLVNMERGAPKNIPLRDLTMISSITGWALYALDR